MSIRSVQSTVRRVCVRHESMLEWRDVILDWWNNSPPTNVNGNNIPLVHIDSFQSHLSSDSLLLHLLHSVHSTPSLSGTNQQDHHTTLFLLILLSSYIYTTSTHIYTHLSRQSGICVETALKKRGRLFDQDKTTRPVAQLPSHLLQHQTIKHPFRYYDLGACSRLFCIPTPLPTFLGVH